MLHFRGRRKRSSKFDESKLKAWNTCKEAFAKYGLCGISSGGMDRLMSP